MPANNNNNVQREQQLGLWEKAFMRDQSWRKDELRTVAFWAVATFSVVLGSFFGLVGLRGLPCFVAFFAGTVGVPSIYWTSFLGVNDEDFGGKMEILGDSMGTGAAIFMLSWIGLFTAIHG
ncbi:hypothetical protein H4R20_001176 [Coemansia guatemalensis]|uniref:Rab5-interacting protein n=1 Tax=Coemansia guatemalensis TaxID=2761395 RepID=A0A9W8LVW7_9FUNG|nr:hypothetical protein H4R20_001176 [Coemansia guatemalensis]